jgi:acyl carrier protein
VTEANVYAELTEIFHEIFADDSVVLKPDTTASDVCGWDSFTNINLILAVETKFGIKMRIQEIEAFKNVGDLVRTIIARGA